MSRSLLLLVFLSNITLQAQVINGSFETGSGDPDPITGWTSPFCDLEMWFSSDTPGGTGSWSLQVRVEDPNQFTCYYTFDMYQYIPWLTPGPSTLKYWYKGHGGEGPPARVMVAALYEGGAPALTSGWIGGNTTTEWVYEEELFYWDGISPSADSLVVLIAGGAASNGPLYSYFDDISISGLTTSIESDVQQAPAFRPNPATDDLWIDLDQMPLSIEAFDITGRSVAMQPSGHVQHTLRINVSDLPCGPVLLRLTMSDGVRTLRFIKA
jgi:hypothetical protein